MAQHLQYFWQFFSKVSFWSESELGGNSMVILGMNKNKRKRFSRDDVKAVDSEI